jgi:hypothetical protein
MPSLLAGKSELFVKNLHHFRQVLKTLNLQCSDTLISFVVSHFIDIPVEEALSVIREMLRNDRTLAEMSAIQVKDIMELLEVCLRNTYSQVNDKFFQQKDSMATSSSLSPVVNIVLEHFEKMTLDMVQDKPLVWLRCFDDAFVVRPHRLNRLQNFFSHLSCLSPSVQCTMEVESDGTLSFLDVLVIKKFTENPPTLATT